MGEEEKEKEKEPEDKEEKENKEEKEETTKEDKKPGFLDNLKSIGSHVQLPSFLSKKDAKTKVKEAFDNIHMPKMPKLHKPAFLKKKKEGEAGGDAPAEGKEGEEEKENKEETKEEKEETKEEKEEGKEEKEET